MTAKGPPDHILLEQLSPQAICQGMRMAEVRDATLKFLSEGAAVNSSELGQGPFERQLGRQRVQVTMGISEALSQARLPVALRQGPGCVSSTRTWRRLLLECSFLLHLFSSQVSGEVKWMGILGAAFL